MCCRSRIVRRRDMRNASPSPCQEWLRRVCRHDCVRARQAGQLCLLLSEQRTPPGAAKELQYHTARFATNIDDRSEEHTSELQSLMRISYAVFCFKKKK